MGKRRPYFGPSESQTMATSRPSPYAESNELTVEWRMDRRSREPRTLRQYVHELRKAYADEVPGRIHSRDTDAGGAPEWTPAFTHYLDGKPSATDPDETYLTPFRAALAYFEDHPDTAQRARGEVVRALVIAGHATDEACRGWQPFERVIALHACRVFWRAMSDVRIVMPRKEAA